METTEETQNEEKDVAVGAQEPAEAPVRSFTQEEVNGLVAKAKRDIQAKYPDYDRFKADSQSLVSEREAWQAERSELQSQLLEAVRRRVAAEAGFPVELITGGSEEECLAQAQAVQKHLEGRTPAAPSSTALGDPTKSALPLNSDDLEQAVRAKLGI